VDSAYCAVRTVFTALYGLCLLRGTDCVYCAVGLCLLRGTDSVYCAVRTVFTARYGLCLLRGTDCVYYAVRTVFTGRYGRSPYIKQTLFAFKGLKQCGLKYIILY
jgi:hypothetical protein